MKPASFRLDGTVCERNCRGSWTQDCEVDAVRRCVRGEALDDLGHVVIDNSGSGQFACAETRGHRDRNRLCPYATFDKSSSSYYAIENNES